MVQLRPQLAFVVLGLAFRLDPRQVQVLEAIGAKAGVDDLAGKGLAGRSLLHCPDTP